MLKKLVIFDLDGTLVDSEDFIVWSFIEAARATGVEVDPVLVADSIGMPLDDIVERVFLSRGVPRRVVEDFIEVRRRIVRENWRKMVKLFPDVVPALNALRDMGFSMAVASSSVVERIMDFLEYFGVLGYFTYISGVKPGLRGKPEPDVILDVLEHAGFKPLDAVYVGDREVDCFAALNAGVDFVLVDRGRGRRVVSECKPVGRVNSLLELPIILKRL